MKKKFSFLILALLAVTAFAYKAATKATELKAVSEETTWDFSKLSSNKESTLYNTKDDGIKLDAEATTPTTADDVVYADATEYITIGEGFDAEAIAFKGQYPIRKNKYCQNGVIHIKAAVAGKIAVTFNDTGSTPSETAVKRYLVVNGEQTEFWVSRQNNSTDPEVAYAAQTNVTAEVNVPAGDVTITGTSAIQVSKIVFTPTAPTTFTITVADGIQNGSVDVSKSEAAEGEMISVSVTPDAGFEVDAITVTGDDQTNIQVTDDQFEMPAQNVTVSATFKATSIEPAGDEEWVLTEPADLLSGDIVVIADTATLIALPNTWEGNKGPAGVDITLNEDRTKITSAVESTTPWTYVEDDGAVKFAKNETDSLYCINDNNGIRVGDGEGTAFVIEANENGSNYLKNVLRTRYIGVYVNNMDWRCYTSVNSNIKGTRTAFYKKVQAVVEPQVVNIEISPADGDLGALVAAEKQTITDAGNIVGDITINLTAGASYTTSQSIEAPANVTITGNGATVDASALDAPFIQMVALESPTEWTEATFNVSGITVKGLKTAFFFSNSKNYVFTEFNIDNCLVEVAGDVTTIDFTKGSTAPTISVTNSTFYAPTATTKSFYSSQSGQKTTEWDGLATQTFKFYNNTMYNLAPSKNFFTHRQNNQKWLVYDVKYNVFVNCGKGGQVIKGINGGGNSANPTWIIEGNAFNFDGADTSAAESTGDEEEPVKNSVAGIITFTSVETPDFGGTFALAEGATAPETALGDPRWTITFGQGYTVTVADGIENGSIQVDKALAIEGDQVTVTATPVEGFELDKITVTAADESNIQVTDGKFLMPAQNVTVSATFRVPPQVIDINISPAEGDLGALVAAEAKTITDAGNLVGNITINLTAGASYTTSQSIEAPANVAINGEGATVTAAAEFADPFITLEGSTTFAKKADGTDSDHYLIADVKIEGVTVSGLQNAFIKDNQKTLLQTLKIINSVIEMPASNKNFIDFNGKGYVGYVGVLNSTIYAKDKNTGFFAQYGSRPKNVNEERTQEFDVENSTIVNIANGKNFCDLKQRGTAQNVCTLKNNLFVECGKPNQVVVGFNGGQVSATPEWNVDGNAFNATIDEVFTDCSAAEVAKAGQQNEEDIVKNSVAGIITFTSVETPDFGGTFALAEGATAPETALGDPRWTITFEAAPIPQEVLWSSETPTDLVWEQQNITIAPEKFENAKVGDVIHVALQDVLANQDYDWKAQVAFRCTNWNTLESPVNVAGTASVDPKEEATWVITGDILYILKTYGAQFNGTGCKTALITLESVPEELGSMQSIWVGNQGGGNIVLDNCHFYNAADFNGVKVGDKILITGVGPQWIGVKYVNGSYAWTDFAGTDVAVTNTYSEENPIVEIEILTDEAAAIFNGKDYHGIVIAMGEDAKGITQIELIPYHEPVVTDINVDVASGEDIGAVVAQAKQTVTENGDIVGNITVNLAENGSFTTSQSIEAPANVTINGISGIVNASALDAPFIQMVALESPTEWTEATFNVSGVTVKGLKTAFFYSNSKNYVFTEFNIDNCLVEVAGDVTTIDFTKGSTAPTISVTNSTFYAPTATTKSFYSSQSGQKTTEWDGEATQTFKFYNNTMYNLAPSKNFFSHRQNNQKWLVYDVKYNVFVNCGKSGQVIKGMNGGGSSANPTWIIEGNAFNFDGADTSAAESTGDDEEPVKNSVAGIVRFTSVETPDFGGSILTANESVPEQIGDPRWTLTYAAGLTVTVADDIVGGKVEVDKTLVEAGDVVTVTATPDEDYLLSEVTAVDADNQPVAVSETYEITMPEKSITVSATFVSQVKGLYDFAGAAKEFDDLKTAGQTVMPIEKVSGSAANGTAFYIWEKAEKTDSYRQDFKGYGNYTGEGGFLPTNGDIWMRSGELHSKITNGGLQCDNNKNIVINNIKAGDKIIIEFLQEAPALDNNSITEGEETPPEKVLTWGVADGYGHRTHAVVGDATKSAVSGETTIASGEAIRIVDTECGYFSFIAPKGIVITKIKITEGDVPTDVVLPGNINLPETVEGGTIKTDKTEAFAGETVTVTATPNSDFELESLTVTNANGDPIEVGEDGTFTMPDGPVNITATFKQKSATGITEINAESDEWQNMLNDGKWYNLQGVRVQTPTKGVFIHEGKKYVVK